MIRRFLIVIMCAFFSQAFSCAESISGFLENPIVDVIDGDTFRLTVKNGGKYTTTTIRLYGIDAPEKNQFGYHTSRFNLIGMLFDGGYAKKDIVVDCRGKDKYGRTLGIVYINGVCINKIMLSRGQACVYKTCKDEEFIKADNKGKSRRIFFINPEEFRKNINDSMRKEYDYFTVRFDDGVSMTAFPVGVCFPKEGKVLILKTISLLPPTDSIEHDKMMLLVLDALKYAKSNGENVSIDVEKGGGKALSGEVVFEGKDGSSRRLSDVMMTAGYLIMDSKQMEHDPSGFLLSASCMATTQRWGIWARKCPVTNDSWRSLPEHQKAFYISTEYGLTEEETNK